jgi:hypothetical protein
MQRCQRASGEIVRSALGQPAAGIGNDQLHALEAAIDQVPQKGGPASSAGADGRGCNGPHPTGHCIYPYITTVKQLPTC